MKAYKTIRLAPLDCAPKSEMHKIANDEFRVALTLRLFLHQKCIIWYDVRLQER